MNHPLISLNLVFSALRLKNSCIISRLHLIIHQPHICHWTQGDFKTCNIYEWVPQIRKITLCGPGHNSVYCVGLDHWPRDVDLYPCVLSVPILFTSQIPQFTGGYSFSNRIPRCVCFIFVCLLSHICAVQNWQCNRMCFYFMEVDFMWC